MGGGRSSRARTTSGAGGGTTNPSAVTATATRVGVAGGSGGSAPSTAAVVVTTAPSTSAIIPSWKDSLGSWGYSGAFTCPVNPIPEWNLPGCGKESRARDTKCEACGRVLRVDWQVGASAAIGSGVENPELKLAGVVTFQSKSGITYRGKVAGIDPRPGPDAPRGVARVKYDDWPYDK